MSYINILISFYTNHIPLHTYPPNLVLPYRLISLHCNSKDYIDRMQGVEARK